ncbi:MAG: chromosomal replication initiator protein DnaA [Elusimicrobia bacterium]|nr:chromosomal replication initiator protein DnaA [Elusimicrobiota bacterium]
MNPGTIWAEALSSIAEDIGQDNLDLWLKPVEAVKIEDKVLFVKLPNKYFLEHIKKHYQPKIEAAIKVQTGLDIALDYSVSRDLHDDHPRVEPLEEVRPQSEFKPSELNPKYTFDTFVVGISNRLAHATAEAIAKNPATRYNPFFVYGGVGLGKTHLMHAIGHAMRKEHPHARVLYTSSEQFVNKFIKSLADKTPDAFRNKYRHLDCLLLDDVQFLLAKGHSEEEFFHTFNALFDSRKQIVITSDRAPKELAPFDERLISRLGWGQVVDIKPPDLETRLAILRKKVEMEQIYVPDDVMLFVASSLKTNIRHLESALIRLIAFVSCTGNPITVDAAKDLLKDSVDTDTKTAVRIETIQQIIAEKYSVEVKDLKSKSRMSEIVFPRQLAMYLSCTLTEFSTPEIGKTFGGRDHATVIHARNKIKEMIERDPFFLEVVNRLIEQIKSVENS